jgi:uncharacterized protein (TIGR03435 family)
MKPTDVCLLLNCYGWLISVAWFRVARPVLCLGATIFSLQPLVAQIATAEAKPPALDIVSVRPIKGDLFSGCPPCGASLTPDGLRANWPALDGVIRTAFDFGGFLFKESQIVGMPAWASKERYNIVGKVGDTDIKRMGNLSSQPWRLQLPVLREMLQAVLADRFQLKAHVEDREGPVYELVVTKNGAKLKAATLCDVDSTGLKDANGKLLPRCKLWGDPGRGRIDAQSESLQFLVNLLTWSAADRVVVDKTGLTGKYDYTLIWTPEQVTPSPRADSGEAVGPSLFTALQEQLGLKLVPAKGPVKTLIIDHLERPSPN